MANNTIDASPGRPQEQHHQQIAKSSVWLNDAQHKQRARYKYFPHIFPSSFSLPKLLFFLLLFYSFIFLATIERRSILRSTKYRKVFLWELSTCGRSVNGRGRAICASIYMCVCVCMGNIFLLIFQILRIHISLFACLCLSMRTKERVKNQTSKRGKQKFSFLKVFRKYRRRQRVVSFEVHKVKVTILKGIFIKCSM